MGLYIFLGKEMKKRLIYQSLQTVKEPPIKLQQNRGSFYVTTHRILESEIIA